jgi:hypothetical protein
LFANTSYAVTKAIRLTLRYTHQNIETAFPGALSKFAIETRNVSVGNTYRLNSNWSNTIEGRFNFSREANADASLEKGFSLNEQIRFGWRGGSLTGFLFYNRKTPSLTSMIVRNPGLLPPALQAAFAIDPAEFLRLNRDRIAFLLAGIELPQTRSTDAGVRFQKKISRFDVSGEVRYNAGEINAVDQKNLYAAASIGIRLDGANAVQIYGWRSFAGSGQLGLTVSYTHRFGASGDGFQFSKLLKLDRGDVRGRVFYDLNGNGMSDTGEPGVAGIKIAVDGKRSVTTGGDGTYEIAANAGTHHVTLISDDLGVRFIASTSTEQGIELKGRQKLELNFGLRDSGSITGGIYNDTPSDRGQNGLAGIRLLLRPADAAHDSRLQERVTERNGVFDFTDLRPGRYLVEVDLETMPANYQMFETGRSTIDVLPLQSSQCDFFVTAERAVTGTVFIDRDGDGVYTEGKDQTVGGAQIVIGDKVVTADARGAYLIRHLPKGRTTLVVNTLGTTPTSFTVEFNAAPETKRRFDLMIVSR